MAVRQQHATVRGVRHGATVGRSKWRRSPKIYGTGRRKLLDEAVLDGEVDQLGAVLQAQGFHQPVFVVLDRACR